MKQELPAIPVQELVKSSVKQVPGRYIFNPSTESHSDANDGSSLLPYMDSPVIDLQLLLDSSSLSSKEELQKLRSVLSSWGCFQLINHGIPCHKLDQVRKACLSFFELPLQEKLKHSRTAEWFEGYGNDTVTENEPFNWNDKLHLKIYPYDQRNLKLWPENLPNFRETVDEYAVGMKKVTETLLKLIAKSLNLEENSFLSYFREEDSMFTRFNFYPPCPNPEQVYGLKPHSDVTLLTILLQDKDVEGLQVLKDDQWFKVATIPDALFVNVGDQLEILSNGIMKSVVHRVMVDKERERISVAIASSPTPDKELGPLSELIDDKRPERYKRVTNYLAIFLQHIARGERAINSIKIYD